MFVAFGVVIVALAGTIAAQSKPSFAGSWKVVPEPTASGGPANAFFVGRDFTATQDARTLTVVRTVPTADASLYPGYKSVFNLDSSESKNSTSIGGNTIDLVSKAKWSESKLIIVTNYSVNGVAVEHTQAWSLDQSGNLRIDQQTVQDGRSRKNEWAYTLAGTLAAQSRPSFSGRWDSVPDKSTPAGSTGVFGKSVSIQQTETTLTMESTGSVMRGSLVNGQLVSGQSESTVTSTYVFDAAEHELRPTGPALTELAGAAAGATAASLPPAVTYRAIWTTGQLVILSTTQAGPSSTTVLPVTLQRLSRASLSLDPDGSLVVDSIAIAAPRAGTAKQNPPAPSRSVYVKKN